MVPLLPPVQKFVWVKLEEIKGIGSKNGIPTLVNPVVNLLSLNNPTFLKPSKGGKKGRTE